MTRTVTLILALSAALGLTATAHAQSATANEVVNPQVTDSVTQANVDGLGDAPANTKGNLMPASEAEMSAANAVHNATSAEQNAGTVLQATTTQGVSLLVASGAGGEKDQAGDDAINPDK